MQFNLTKWDDVMQSFLITRKNPNNGFTETITHTGYPRKLPKGWKLHNSEKWRLAKKVSY